MNSSLTPTLNPAYQPISLGPWIVKVRFVLPYKAGANPGEAAKYRGYYKGDL